MYARHLAAVVAAAALIASGSATSGLVMSGAATATSYAAPAAPRAAPACTLAALDIHKGRLEGAAGSRFQTVRVTNRTDHPCRTPGWTRYRFLNSSGVIGFPSPPNPGALTDDSTVLIRAGQTVRSVLSWVDPGPVPPGQCHARTATAFRMHLRGLPAFHQFRLRTEVCTTKKYRPHGTRLAHG